jgi:phosphate starvation-inducible PhoH-like protein
MTSQNAVIVPFEDNRLAAELFGEFDAHLALLENRLDIEVVAHGNVVTLRGSDSSCIIAQEVLEGLYDRLAEGEAISTGDIEGAIRHARAHPADEGKGLKKSRVKMEQIRTRKRAITARSLSQSAYLKAMSNKDLVFSTGPAGTGKTYLAVAFAAAMLERGEVERLILSRPAIEAGERLGFLPGDMREKVDPYLRPLYDALYDVLAPDKVDRDLETGVIEIAPLAFMRGRTLSNAAIILDEAQNCTHTQMKMFLTRIGEGSKMIVTGDPTQIDLPPGQNSGLAGAIELLDKIPDISHIAFTRSDVVRRELVSKIVAAYEGED